MSLKPHKILLAQHMLGTGGIDRVAVHLANGFAANAYDTRQLLFCADGPLHAFLSAEIAPEVKLHHLGKRGRMGRTADLLRLLPAFISYLRDDPPDILISTANNMHWVCAYARHAAGLKRTRLALKITNPVIRQRDGLIWRWLRDHGYTRTFAAADGVWTLSDAENTELAGYFPTHADKMQPVINPYVTDAMLNIGRTAVAQTTPPTILAIGRLNVQKRFDLLIQAVALLPRGSVRLVILGEGEERSKLEALVQRLGLCDHVQMPGFIDNVAAWFLRASLFVLSSRYEGLPAVVLEAMAANCPVLATACFPAAHGLLADVAGAHLVIPPTPEHLAACIQKSLDGPRSYSLATTAERWSITNGVDSHVQALEAIF